MYFSKKLSFTTLLLIFITINIFALPKEIQWDHYLAKIQKLTLKKDYGSAIDYFKKASKLKIKLPDDFYYNYGIVAIDLKKNNLLSDKITYKEIKKIFTKYLIKTGKKGKYYRKALDYYGIAEDNIIKEEQERLKSKRNHEFELFYSKNKTMEINCDNGVCNIPAGDFIMGCNETSDKECDNDETPTHKVYLDSFQIDQNEVRVVDFKKCVKAGKCSSNNFKTQKDSHFYNYGNKKRNNHPMNAVNWYGAKEYCKFVGKRLPTEAEWEKAAKGTDGRIYPWGNERANCYYSIMKSNKSDACKKNKTWPVNSRLAGKSPYGLANMSGNVWEWVSDYYGKNYYKNSPYKNPKGLDKGIFRILKGGGWRHNSKYQRSSDRFKLEASSSTSFSGFRCVK